MIDDEVLREFLIESRENLDQLDREFVALESDPAEQQRIGAIFRTIHTIKGTAGFLGLGRLEALTHAGESVLSRLRDGEIPFTAEITSTLLAMADGVRMILAKVEATGSEGEPDFTALIARLQRYCTGNPSDAHATIAPAAPVPIVESAAPIASTTAPATTPAHAIATTSASEPEPARTKSPAAAEASAHNERPASIADSTIRVDVVLLDRLMNQVGELVLTRNQLLQFASATDESATFHTACQRLNLITTELQEGVMKTRMQPIGNIWQKFPRIVRDLAAELGKKIELEMEGEGTELDKTLIEAIKDPLTHIVRNSVDHGIEKPDARAKRGKNPQGTLRLKAFHEGGQVNIEISDDGSGIDTERVRAKAIEKGLVTPDQASRMSEREAWNLIFAPGFSTAEKITNVSGRGVGMDVVKTNIERLGGTVDLSSEQGKGTTLRLKIPLTLAIIPALIVRSGRNRYAIPQVNLLKLVRLEGEQAKRGIERIHGVPVYRLRGSLLPLVHLHQELGHAPGAQESDGVNIVVLQAGERQFGLIVDAIMDTEEIVVKPMGKQLKGLSVFAGATIMGDGRVALILDVLGIATRSRVVSELRERSLAAGTSLKAAAEDQKRTMLLFKSRDEGRMAVELSQVARLEEFPCSAIEHAGSIEAVQYRGQIMPLVRVASVLPERRKQRRVEEEPAANETVHVIVHQEGERVVGLRVGQIIDIVEETITVQMPATRTGILGTVVIQGRVTELLDVDWVIRHASIDTQALETESVGAAR